MKTVLVAINAKYIHSNLAVYSLRSYARTFGYEPELLEFTINQQKDQILKGIYEAKPDLLCFSCYIWNLSYAEEIIEDIKKSCQRLRFGRADRKCLMTHQNF